ncbi:MAG: phosphoglycerate kinase [Pseudomonadales bacterium]|nr:phosphoglycerate kinase [Candidatus Woesebacteria bacterium]MCB9801794.1 phosphoglycerate kinase [Pseudomonadales bacterium]
MRYLDQQTKQALKGKRVLVRVDYNVPVDAADTPRPSLPAPKRVENSLETIHFLLKNDATPILCSHRGRPKGKEERYSLKPLATILSDQYNIPCSFSPDCIGDIAYNIIQNTPLNSMVLLENLRFYDGEKTNDATFAKQLAELADLYVNDAFSTAHRNHASVVGVPLYLPSYAGMSFAREVTTLTTLLEKPERPFIVVLGGAKISDKVSAVKNLSNQADMVLIGGAVANNFLKAEGLEIYRSFIEEQQAVDSSKTTDFVAFAGQVLADHAHEKVLKDDYIPIPKLLAPIDVIAAPSAVLHKDEQDRAAPQHEVVELTHDMLDKDESEDKIYVDIGPKTQQLYQSLLASAKTIFWNGPMGVWEQPEFSDGTKTIAESVAGSNGYTVIGGGDTIAAVDHFGLENKFSYISAAGGSALAFLGGEVLPGIAALEENTQGA